MQQKENYSKNESQQSMESSSISTNNGNITSTPFSKQEILNKSFQFQNNQDKKCFPKPIGIYNFNSNKSEISSLEENIDEIVSSFIDQNKESIIKYVVDEVQNKLNEKIQPLNTEINNLKNNFNSLYHQELKEFKELDILNDCHNNILNINNKVNIMNENIDKYNNEVKGFNVADNRLQFLNKLNKDLQEFINGINRENENNMDIEIDNEKNKIDNEQKKQENFNNELDNIFYETMTLLKPFENNGNTQINNVAKINNCDILENLKNAINDFEMKFNYENPIINEKNNNNNLPNDSSLNKKNNIFDSIPDFFG